MATLLTTKLHQPASPSKRVERPQLMDRLNAAMEAGHPVILVSAPAGFGKTSCVSAWLNSIDRYPYTWLSLDPKDDDPGRFFIYLLAALQQIHPYVGREIEGILRAGRVPPAEIIGSTIINDLQAVERRFLLVLDDLQAIQDELIVDVLKMLVENQPVALCLVLITREDPPLPLARLRARNQLTEIRSGDLRFSRAEIERFLKDVMGLSLSQIDLSILEERTEGWIAGLHLAGLSIRDRADPSAHIARLSGNQRFILSYLTEEVLNQQPQDILEFLVHTSILDRLNAALCNAVTGRPDSGALLERLFAENLFMIPLDDIGLWYRYHHLFADFLRERLHLLEKREVARLHQNASRWYEQAGLTNEAIHHALAGSDYETAVRLIEQHAMDLLIQWHVKTVEGWMRAIPSEWIENSVRANLVFAWLHLMQGNPIPATPYLERLTAIFDRSQAGEIDAALQARWLALQSMLLNAQGKPSGSLGLAQQALDNAPPDDVLVRSQIYLGMANSYQQLNDYPHALEAFQLIALLSRESANSVSEMLGIAGMALLAIQHGELHFAFEIVSKGVERMEHLAVLPPVSTALYGELGEICYQWHQLELAHSHFRRAIKVSTLSGYRDAELYYGVILSRLYQIAGDLEAAASEIQKAVDLMQVEAPSVVGEEILAQQVRVFLAQGRLASAEAVLKNLGFSFGESLAIPEPDANMERPEALLYISALRILLYHAEIREDYQNLQRGFELANLLIGGALDRHHIPLAIELVLVRARMHTVAGDETNRLADVGLALELAEPEGFISIFVEEGPSIAEALDALIRKKNLAKARAIHAQSVLDAFKMNRFTEKPSGADIQMEIFSGKSETEPALIEPLTPREIEVLRLMAQGLKYKEISHQLYISLNTVRTHVKAMYGKLNVNNRMKAIAMAKKLNLF